MEIARCLQDNPLEVSSHLGSLLSILRPESECGLCVCLNSAGIGILMGEDFSVLAWCVGPSGIIMVLLAVHCPLEMVVSIILDPLILLESIVHR